MILINLKRIPPLKNDPVPRMKTTKEKAIVFGTLNYSNLKLFPNKIPNFKFMKKMKFPLVRIILLNLTLMKM